MLMNLKAIDRSLTFRLEQTNKFGWCCSKGYRQPLNQNVSPDGSLIASASADHTVIL